MLMRIVRIPKDIQKRSTFLKVDSTEPQILPACLWSKAIFNILKFYSFMNGSYTLDNACILNISQPGDCRWFRASKEF